MTERVELEVIGRHCGRCRRVVIDRRRADEILDLAARGAWPEFHFRYQPHEDDGMTWAAIVALAIAWSKKGKAHWEAIVIALALSSLTALVVFTPKWERPILGLLGAGLFMAGIVAGKKYLK